MSFLQGWLSNWLAAEQLIKLDEISQQREAESGYSEPLFDWDDPAFCMAADKIEDVFYASHPEIVREKGGIRKNFPDKGEAVRTINRLASNGKLSALEYLTIYREILSPKEAS